MVVKRPIENEVISLFLTDTKRIIGQYGINPDSLSRIEGHAREYRKRFPKDSPEFLYFEGFLCGKEIYGKPEDKSDDKRGLERVVEEDNSKNGSSEVEKHSEKNGLKIRKMNKRGFFEGFRIDKLSEDNLPQEGKYGLQISQVLQLLGCSDGKFKYHRKYIGLKKIGEKRGAWWIFDKEIYHRMKEILSNDTAEKGLEKKVKLAERQSTVDKDYSKRVLQFSPGEIGYKEKNIEELNVESLPVGKFGINMNQVMHFVHGAIEDNKPVKNRVASSLYYKMKLLGVERIREGRFNWYVMNRETLNRLKNGLSEDRHNSESVKPKVVKANTVLPGEKNKVGYLVHSEDFSEFYLQDLTEEALPKSGCYLTSEQISMLAGSSLSLVRKEAREKLINGEIMLKKERGRRWYYVTPDSIKEFHSERGINLMKKAKDPFEREIPLRDIIQQAGKPYAESWEIAEVCNNLGINIPEGTNEKMSKQDARNLLLKLKDSRSKKRD